MKRRLFLLQEHALLASRRASSTCKKGMFSNAVYNTLIACRLEVRLQVRLYSYLEGILLDVM
jgi:hypothetical protein